MYSGTIGFADRRMSFDLDIVAGRAHRSEAAAVLSVLNDECLRNDSERVISSGNLGNRNDTAQSSSEKS
jgi:hypothetical protein